MANFNEQVLMAWDEWTAQTGQDAGNPDDFVVWAMNNNKLAPHPQDIRKLLRKDVTRALRQASRVDERGITYRAKQSVIVNDGDAQMALWFDTDKGGTPNLRKKTVYQRREAIANDVYRAMCDVEHMNFVHDENTQFPLDFSDDYEEKKAADPGRKKGDKAA